MLQRPPIEVADIVRAVGKSFVENSRDWITGQHLKVLRAIKRCRTADLGYHFDECTNCGYSGYSYNSCRNRHCPKCQANARLRWINGRKKKLLPRSTDDIGHLEWWPLHLCPRQRVRSLV